MRRASRVKLLHRLSMLAIDMIGMVVSMPPVIGIEVRYQQALAMMPACAKDIIIFLTLRRAFFLAQAIPFAMGMFLNSPGYYRSGNRAITRRLEEEAEVNIHQAIKTEFLINPANFRQQFSPGPDVDAIEAYLMAFRRELLPEVGWVDEKFRFYRLMDIYFSFFFKTSGYRAVTTPIVAGRIEKHPHREWYSLSEEERATKSKKNYDIFRARWHHGESLLVANFDANNWWHGHNHAYHVDGEHTQSVEELHPAGTTHAHEQRHWPDQSHAHPHYHETRR